MIKKSIKVKILGVVFFSIFLITAALGYFSFEFSKARIVTMLGDSIRGIATTVAGFVSPEDVSLIMANLQNIKELETLERYNVTAFSDISAPGPEGNGGPSDASLRAIKAISGKYSKILGDIKTVNKIDSPIHVFVTSGNRFHSVLTSERSLPVTASYSLRPEARKALADDMARATGIYKDKDGTWISAYAPGGYIPSKNERIVVEINYKVDSYIAILRRELAAIIAICIAGFLITASLSYYLITTLVSGIKSLDEAAGDLERERYDKPIDIKTDDEIGHLATTFDMLRISIKKKIEELRQALLREKKAHLESVVALTNAIEARDPYTKEHVGRVQEYALLIAKALRLPHDQVVKLKYSCVLHDVGKIYIEDALLKKAKLTPQDFEEIKKHSERGAKIIEGIQFLTDVKDIVLYHQERYDGKGYPDGLKGDEIPLLARIVSVADAFDAMTTDRPYRPKMSFEEAVGEIRRNSGTQFDPAVCDAFLRYRDTLEAMMKKRSAGI